MLQMEEAAAMEAALYKQLAATPERGADFAAAIRKVCQHRQRCLPRATHRTLPPARLRQRLQHKWCALVCTAGGRGSSSHVASHACNSRRVSQTSVCRVRTHHDCVRVQVLGDETHWSLWKKEGRGPKKETCFPFEREAYVPPPVPAAPAAQPAGEAHDWQSPDASDRRAGLQTASCSGSRG